MPPSFSAAERARISRVLLEAGQRLFTTQGLRKTSLDDLVGPAGIAKSSFYAFFDSKEALYLELMLAQMAEVKHAVIDQGLLAETSTREGLRRFLHVTIDRLSTDPLYGRLITHPEEMRAVAGKLDPARVTSAPDNPVTALTRFIEARRHDGELVPADPAVISGVLQAVLLLPVYREHLGDPALYPHIRDLLIDVVAAGLTPQKD